MCGNSRFRIGLAVLSASSDTKTALETDQRSVMNHPSAPVTPILAGTESIK